MVRSILIGVVYTAMVLAPWAIAKFRLSHESHKTQ
jgi:hypothetical protein